MLHSLILIATALGLRLSGTTDLLTGAQNNVLLSWQVWSLVIRAPRHDQHCQSKTMWRS